MLLSPENQESVQIHTHMIRNICVSWMTWVGSEKISLQAGM